LNNILIWIPGHAHWVAPARPCARDIRASLHSTGSREAAGGSGAAFSLVTFFWPGKRKLPAVGQPPTSSLQSSPKGDST